MSKVYFRAARTAAQGHLQGHWRRINVNALRMLSSNIDSEGGYGYGCPRAMVATIMIVTRLLAYSNFLNSHAAWTLPRIVHRLEAIDGVGNECQ